MLKDRRRPGENFRADSLDERKHQTARFQVNGNNEVDAMWHAQPTISSILVETGMRTIPCLSEF